VAVDARPSSPTFGQWASQILTGESGFQLYIPPGFLHGFLVVSETAHVVYKTSDYYHPEGEVAVRWDDPGLSIRWPRRPDFLSGKDRIAPFFAALRDRFSAFQ
jgi:dTDP-4-dehydrorhamnose 3,5-epimerase